MSDEIHDWLADLRGSDPPTAMLVGEALTALMSEGASLGPTLAGSLASAPRPGELLEALDQSYQDMVEQLTAARRRAADAATAARDTQDQIAEVGEQSQRLQARTDAFRIRKETLKAAYTAARASLVVHEAVGAMGLAGDDSSGQEEDPGKAVAEAAAQLGDVTARIERELGH